MNLEHLLLILKYHCCHLSFLEMSKQQRRKLKFKKREERRKERERRRQNKKNKESDVELGPLGTFLKSIIVANTFVD